MQIARSIRDHARSVSLYLKVGVVRNIDSAIHAARTAKSICILPSRKEAEFLKDTPLEILDPPPEIAETLTRWGMLLSCHLFTRFRPLLSRSRFLLIEGRMQNVDGSLTVRAEMIKPLNLTGVEMTGRSFR
jgi:hypothetical protein